MIPELGHFALILALSVAVVQTILPLVGAAKGIPQWTAVAVPAARMQFLFTGIAFGCLTYAFVTNDFSVAYVAHKYDRHRIYAMLAATHLRARHVAQKAAAHPGRTRHFAGALETRQLQGP